jgi:hypothetical protein
MSSIMPQAAYGALPLHSSPVAERRPSATPRQRPSAWNRELIAVLAAWASSSHSVSSALVATSLENRRVALSSGRYH